jgi:4-carboxymuconolactone decarboxylase
MMTLAGSRAKRQAGGGPLERRVRPHTNTTVVLNGGMRMERIANIVVEAQHLENYRAALKEEIETSIKLEPGVLTLYAVSAREDPTRFVILEIYADQTAYEAHIKTPHFLKYKSVTQGMVKSLELVDAVALVPGMKVK